MKKIVIVCQSHWHISSALSECPLASVPDVLCNSETGLTIIMMIILIRRRRRRNFLYILASLKKQSLKKCFDRSEKAAYSKGRFKQEA